MARKLSTRKKSILKKSVKKSKGGRKSTLKKSVKKSKGGKRNSVKKSVKKSKGGKRKSVKKSVKKSKGGKRKSVKKSNGGGFINEILKPADMEVLESLATIPPYGQQFNANELLKIGRNDEGQFDRKIDTTERNLDASTRIIGEHGTTKMNLEGIKLMRDIIKKYREKMGK
tara:strand:+ start:54 stop:566 length:513 start_codon:yes stop_codon:yes gene_type:complete